MSKMIHINPILANDPGASNSMWVNPTCISMVCFQPDPKGNAVGDVTGQVWFGDGEDSFLAIKGASESELLTALGLDHVARPVLGLPS